MGIGARDRVFRTLAAVLVGACGAGSAFVLLRSHLPRATPPPSETGTASEPPTEPAADWCAPQFEPIAGDGCFAASTGTRADRPLVVYLHGRYARDVAGEEIDRQRRLAVRATARGFAVLALRGRLGACTAPELATWFCWPSNERNEDAAATFVGAWTEALSTAEQRAASRSRFLLGFSNGGYFAGLIALRGLLRFDAVVVAHGGLVERAPVLGDRPPILLLSADDDVAQDDMILFDEELVRVGWAHDSYARAGAHALSDEDIDAALTFFSRATESLPLKPPLPLHRAIRHPRDAGVAAGSSEAEATEEDQTSTAPSGAKDESPSGSADEVEEEAGW